MVSPGWQRLPASEVARVDLVPHAIFDEADQVAAIGFMAYLRKRKGAAGRQRVDLPTSEFDDCVPCPSLAAGHFKAAALAFRSFAKLRPDLTRHARIVVQDQALNFVVKMHRQPEASLHVARDTVSERAELLAAMAPYQTIFRFHYYGRDGKPLPKPIEIRRLNLVRALEKRLLWRQFGRRTPPRPAKTVVAVEDLGALMEARRKQGQRVPSLLEALVAHLHERGYKHERIAKALSIDQRAVRNALARWRAVPTRSEAKILVTAL